jgi:hypothetical protein
VPVVPVVPMVDELDPVVVWAITAPGNATAASRAIIVFVIKSIRCYSGRGCADRLLTTLVDPRSATPDGSTRPDFGSSQGSDVRNPCWGRKPKLLSADL